MLDMELGTAIREKAAGFTPRDIPSHRLIVIVKDFVMRTIFHIKA